MPNLRFSTALVANQLGANPISGWQFEYIPWPQGAAVKLISRATTVNVRQTLYSGSQTIVERSPVQAGGTAGSTPSELNSSPDIWVAGPGDRLKVLFDEVGGAAAVVDGIISVEPL